MAKVEPLADERDHVLETLIDLEHYPLLSRGSPGYIKAVENARAGLAGTGCARLTGFIRHQLKEHLRNESLELAPEVQVKSTTMTPYVSSDDSFPEDHPRRNLQQATNGFVTRDLIPESTLIQQLYSSPSFMQFLADCFEKEKLFKFADPMRGLVVNVMPSDTSLPWHFDANEFIVTLMTVRPESGGIFEYCPGIRTPHEENYQDVHSVLDGDRSLVRELELNVGDLQLFKGQYSLHRVREGQGDRHTAIFGYSEGPGYIGTAESTRQAYGRCMQEHIDADEQRDHR
jgi:hypothetical protein